MAAAAALAADVDASAVFSASDTLVSKPDFVMFPVADAGDGPESCPPLSLLLRMESNWSLADTA